MNGQAKIQMGGQDVPLFFGYTSFKSFAVMCSKFKDTHLAEDEGMTVLGMARLFYCAYENACFQSGKDLIFTFDDFSEWLDKIIVTDEGMEEVKKLLEVWAQSNTMKKVAADAPVEEKKSETEIVTT
jgi:hypothetical protein